MSTPHALRGVGPPPWRARRDGVEPCGVADERRYPRLVMARRRGWWLQGLFILVVGGLVYMHGVDPGPGAPHVDATSLMGDHSRHDSGDTPPAGEPHEDRSVHLVALCVAVLGSAVAGRLSRLRPPRPVHLAPLLAGWDTRPAVATKALRPPGLGPPVLGPALC
jgi:hypothetical protein